MENQNLHIEFLLKTIEIATNGVKQDIGGPFGAIVTLNNTIIAQTSNSVTSTNDPTAHAEVNAIREACKHLNHHQLTDCILYSSCEPCPMCLGAIYWARPKAVYFACNANDAAQIGFDDSYIYEQVSLNYSNRDILMVNLKLDNQLKPFQKWYKKEDKVLY